MEREHLIIIALILVALYMMNKGTNDTVVSMGPAGPMGRIRYTTDEDLQRMGGAPGPGPNNESFAIPQGPIGSFEVYVNITDPFNASVGVGK